MAELTPEEQGFIVHSETRMHLPELADHCVDCLRQELAEVTRHRDLIAAALKATRRELEATRRELGEVTPERGPWWPLREEEAP